MNRKLINLLFTGIIVYALFVPKVKAQVIPFNEENWENKAQGVIMEPFKGYQSVYLSNGAIILKDVTFLNGTIEYDVYLDDRRGFQGILFRMEDGQNYEEVYLRPHQSGNPDAMQYTPVFNGRSGWQLYHDQGTAVFDGQTSWKVAPQNGYNAIYEYPFDRWLHVKLEIYGTTAQVYFDHEEEPTLIIPELKHGTKAGGIGLKAARSPVHYANFTYTSSDKPLSINTSNRAANPEGMIDSWQLSSTFEEKLLDKQLQLDKKFVSAQQWTKLDAEHGGLINISRAKTASREKNTVLAKVIIKANQAQIKRLNLGYSDRIRVYCNGQILYSGNNGFRTRDYRYLGTIGLFDSVYLPLKKGDNEIVIAVSDNFGGWGLMGQLENESGISVKL
ncbi:MAG: hypothetical protein AAFX87_26875 [Bacteroidota bacterium]